MQDASFSVTITHLNHEGEGVGTYHGKKICVPYSLPGEKVRVKKQKSHKNVTYASLLEIEVPSPARTSAPCPHFGKCGGCALQHMDTTSYHDYKQSLLIQALTYAGLNTEAAAPLITIPPHSRRRATFKVSGKQIGFYAPHSHTIITLRECTILAPALAKLLQSLKKLLPTLTSHAAIQEIHATLAENGIDLSIIATSAPSFPDLESLTDFAETEPVIRITWKEKDLAPYPVLIKAPVQITLGDVRVDLPEGSFLQATSESANAITQEILAAAEKGKAVLDLYAGCGTYSFPLSAYSPVHAVEGYMPMVSAMRAALKRVSLPHKLEITARDLFHDPFTKEELAPYHTVVINPPRNGAGTQIKAIADSAVPVVAMVSCNPATFSRDAKLLREGGYNLQKAVAVDQFLWSAHLEIVAIFTK